MAPYYSILKTSIVILMRQGKRGPRNPLLSLFFFFFAGHCLPVSRTTSPPLFLCAAEGRRYPGRRNKQASCRANSDENVLPLTPPYPPTRLFLPSNVEAALAAELGPKWVCGASPQLCHP